MTQSFDQDQDRVVSGASRGDEEERLQASLRPRALNDFIGQDREKLKLHVAIEAALGRGEPLDHLLLHGPPGLGKTTLSMIVAREMSGNLISTSGPALEKTADLMGMLTNLDEGDVFFIDEIHRTPRVIEEYLYPAMEDFKVDFVLDKGPFAKAIPLPLKRFTLVGATTRIGLLSAPLRDRFGLTFALHFYGVEDLVKIVNRSAGLLGVTLAEGAAAEIAGRARGTPRVANRLLRRVRDYAQVYAQNVVDLEVVRRALDLEGVDSLGLDDLDRRYLRTLIVHYGGGPAGINALAATMQQEQDTLEDVVEPYLLYEGFVVRTPTGRRATARAFAHLGLTPPPPAQPQLPLDATTSAPSPN
jgi:holliday junction DNA helicase RuvB